MAVTELLARRPLVLIVVGTVLFSAAPVIVAGTATTGPVLSFWRLWSGAVVMGGAAWWHRRRTGHRPDRIGRHLAVASGAAFGVHQLLFMVSIKRTSVVDVTLMQLLAPVIVAVLAAVAFGERPRPAFRAWSAVSMAGAAVVVLAGAGGPRGDPLGIFLAAGNVVFYALYFIGSKRARAHIETSAFLFVVVVTSGVLVSLYVVAAGEPVGGVSAGDLLGAVGLAVVPGGLGHFVTTWQLHRVPANVPPTVHLAIPFLAGAMAWVFLGQGVDALQVVGGAVTLVGVAGAVRTWSGGPVPDAEADAPAHP